MSRGTLLIYSGPGTERELAPLGLLVRSAGYGRKGCIIDFFDSASAEVDRGAADATGGLVRVFPVDGERSEHSSTVERAWATAGEIIRNRSYDVVILRGLPEAIGTGKLSEEDVLGALSDLPADLSVVVVGGRIQEFLIRLADVVTDVVDLKASY